MTISEDSRLFTIANTAALLLFNEHGNPPTITLSQKVLAEQGETLLKAYKETVVVPAMEEIAKNAAAAERMRCIGIMEENHLMTVGAVAEP